MAMPGTGSAGMEAVFVNLLEPGDKVIICVHGLFGERMVDIAGRIGCSVVTVESAWGEHIDPGKS
jgi:alanine-glyoxylate transaminase / serine-glyoxylate transaminase / serine-pyruvate transaminase